jgi:hypothetical protein
VVVNSLPSTKRTRDGEYVVAAVALGNGENRCARLRLIASFLAR